jgi:hypothetical protein
MQDYEISKYMSGNRFPNGHTFGETLNHASRLDVLTLIEKTPTRVTYIVTCFTRKEAFCTTKHITVKQNIFFKVFLLQQLLFLRVNSDETNLF